MTALAVAAVLSILLAVVLLVHAAPAVRSGLMRPALRADVPDRHERLWWPDPDVPVPRAAAPRQHVLNDLT